MSPYFLIFLNSVQSAFILSLRSEFGWFAALSFGNYDMLLATVLAVVGSTAGLGINFGMGYYFSRYHDSWPGVSDERYMRAAKFFRRYLVWLLFFPLPFLSTFTAASGLLRVPPRMAFTLIVVGRIGYYCFHLFYVGY